MGEKSEIYAKIKRINDAGALVAKAVVVVNDCVAIRSVHLLRGKNGLFVSFPSKQAYDAETKQPKVNEEGKPVYEEVIFPVTAEAREAITEAVKKAYCESIDNYAYVKYDKQGDNKAPDISVTMYEKNGEHIKAAGSIVVDDICCKDVLVRVNENEQGKKFASVSYPAFQAKDQSYVPFFEFKSEGKAWSNEFEQKVIVNFSKYANRLVVEKAKESSIELRKLLSNENQQKSLNAGDGNQPKNQKPQFVTRSNSRKK